MKQGKSKVPIADEWDTIIRSAIADYLAAGGNVHQLSLASGYQEIAIWQYIQGKRQTITLANASKLAGALGLTIRKGRR